jgi:RNA polymerase-binding transcription factor DksA
MATKKHVQAKPSKAPAKAVVKKAAKQVAKKAAPAAKIAPKKVAKPAAKAAPKPVKKAVAKAPVKKAAPKKVAKPAPKPAAVKKTIPVKKAPVQAKVAVKVAVKPAQKAMAKKEETKKATTPVKETPVKATANVKAKDIKVPAPKPVVIPKISTTTARKYEPDFTKSVLDKAPVEHNTPTQRYSDGELAEFRELIQRKLDAAKKELTYLQGLITRKDDMGGDEGDNRYMTMEDGSLSMEREQLSQMASRQITFIDHLEKALMRIENKTYGICRVTGKLIDKARLRAVPHATLSIEAKMGKVN